MSAFLPRTSGPWKELSTFPVPSCHPSAPWPHTPGGNSGPRGSAWGGSLASTLRLSVSGKWGCPRGITAWLLSGRKNEPGSQRTSPCAQWGRVLAAVFPEPPAAVWNFYFSVFVCKGEAWASGSLVHSAAETSAFAWAKEEMKFCALFQTMGICSWFVDPAAR